MALITPSMRQMQLSKAHALTATVGGVNCFELDFGARSNPVCVCVSLPPICLQINLSEIERRRERERQPERKKRAKTLVRAHMQLVVLFSHLEGYSSKRSLSTGTRFSFDSTATTIQLYSPIVYKIL